MDPITQQLALACAGASDGPLYVDDVFSIDLYEGNSSARSITNGIDLAGEGGMIWHKARGSFQGSSQNHAIHDTERGTFKHLKPNSTDAAWGSSYGVSAYNNNGYSLNAAFDGQWNGVHLGVATEYVSWTFRKAPGFFDVVTWTGDGASSRAISHNLDSTPGFIVVKSTSHTGNWICWHKNTTQTSSTANYVVALNDDDTEKGYTRINTVGSSSFSVSSVSSFIGGTNVLGVSYVAYVFADDDQRFGTNENESIIKCGKYDSVYQTDVNVNLGFEPQWLLIKNIDANNHDWVLYDPMRGLTHDFDTGSRQQLIANGANDEANSSGIELNSTGFKLLGSNPSNLNTWGSGVTNRYIYVAIRRPHKPPSNGTDVFTPVFSNVSENRYASTGWTSQSGFPTDTIWTKPETIANWLVDSRLIESYMKFNLTDTEIGTSPFGFDTQDGVKEGPDNFPTNGVKFADWHFKRAAGFHDVVLYDGDGSSHHSLTHNLNAVPELIIVKRRSGGTGYWHTYVEYLGNTRGVALNTSNAAGSSTSLLWANTSPTSTQFTVGGSTHLNKSGNKYYAQLFASVPGVSKIGSYTGIGNTGNNVNVDCGFTNGARFILIKRTDASGDWYLYDTARGISSTGNDPYYNTNNTDTETNLDYLNAFSSGFTVKSTAPAALNANGGTYLFFAIA